MSGTIKANVQLGDSVTAANNFVITAEANDGTMKLARGNKGATTQDVMTVDAAGKVAFPATQGAILQVQTFTDAGSSTTSNVYTNLSAGLKPITPRSANSTIIVSISGLFGCANSTGFNSVGNFQIYRDAVANLIGASCQVSALTGSGGNGASCAGNITALYTNTTLAVKSFGIVGYNSINTVSAFAQNLVITITEVQN